MIPSGTALVARVAASLGAARAALQGAPGESVHPESARPESAHRQSAAPSIVRRIDGASPVAFLAALTQEGDCCAVVPLGAGRNIVGRQGATAQHDWAPHEPPLVEAGQWVIRCNEDRTAEVADAWSTNGSVLLPAAALAELPESTGVPRLPRITGHPAATPLVHPGYSGQKLAYRPIAEGELLIGIYRAFVLGWL